MDITTFLAALKRRSGMFMLWVFLFLIVAAAVSFSQPLKYRASSRLLIVQEGGNMDPYAIAKSNQYLGSLLAETAYSGSFFELMPTTGNNINWSYFQGDYKEKVKQWKKTITVTSQGDTGIITVEIYHPNKEQARLLAVAVNNLFITKNSLYQSSGSNLNIRVIDQPVLSSWPVRPNLLLNFGGALLGGILFGLIYIYYFPVSRKIKRGMSIKISKTPVTPVPQSIVINTPHNSPNNNNDKTTFQGNIRNIIN